MFTGAMQTEPIPARVFALYKIVSDKKSIKRSDLKELMEPASLNADKTGYFSIILATAEEIGIVNEVDNIVSPAVPKEDMKTMNDLRQFVANELENFSDGHFYKATDAMLNINEFVLKNGNIADLAIRNRISEVTGELYSAPEMRGWRFWASFLGFGTIQNMVYLPNAYVFVKTILKNSGFDKNQQMLFSEFIEAIGSKYAPLIKATGGNQLLNLAFSNALQELHLNHEIELIDNKDRDTSQTWTLYPSQTYFSQPITDVIYKGVRS